MYLRHPQISVCCVSHFLPVMSASCHLTDVQKVRFLLWLSIHVSYSSEILWTLWLLLLLRHSLLSSQQLWIYNALILLFVLFAVFQTVHPSLWHIPFLPPLEWYRMHWSLGYKWPLQLHHLLLLLYPHRPRHSRIRRLLRIIKLLCQHLFSWSGDWSLLAWNHY